MVLRKLTVEFGKEGYKRLLEKYGKVDEEAFKEFFRDTINQKLPSSVNHYESAIDWQVDYLVSESMRKLKEGKVFDKYYVFYYYEPEIHEALSNEHSSDSRFINRLSALSRKMHVPQSKLIDHWKSAKREYLQKVGKGHAQLTDRDYERVFELALKKIGLWKHSHY